MVKSPQVPRPTSGPRGLAWSPVKAASPSLGYAVCARALTSACMPKRAGLRGCFGGGSSAGMLIQLSSLPSRPHCEERGLHVGVVSVTKVDVDSRSLTSTSNLT